jgi:hypothetical protein
MKRWERRKVCSTPMCEFSILQIFRSPETFLRSLRHPTPLCSNTNFSSWVGGLHQHDSPDKCYYHVAWFPGSLVPFMPNLSPPFVTVMVLHKSIISLSTSSQKSVAPSGIFAEGYSGAYDRQSLAKRAAWSIGWF